MKIGSHYYNIDAGQARLIRRQYKAHRQYMKDREHLFPWATPNRYRRFLQRKYYLRTVWVNG